MTPNQQPRKIRKEGKLRSVNTDMLSDEADRVGVKNEQLVGAPHRIDLLEITPLYRPFNDIPVVMPDIAVDCVSHRHLRAQT